MRATNGLPMGYLRADIAWTYLLRELSARAGKGQQDLSGMTTYPVGPQHTVDDESGRVSVCSAAALAARRDIQVLAKDAIRSARRFG